MMRPATRVKPVFTSTGTRITRPAANADMPRAPSKYRGSSTDSENMSIMATTTSTVAGQKRMLFIGVISISGKAQRV